MDGWTSTLWIVGAFVLARVLGLVWATLVGWHLPLQLHRWLFPALVFPLGIGALMLFYGDKTTGQVVVIAGGFVLLLLDETVGAGCPGCGKRLRHKHTKYGPQLYRCGSCDFRWSSREV